MFLRDPVTMTGKKIAQAGSGGTPFLEKRLKDVQQICKPSADKRITTDLFNK